MNEIATDEDIDNIMSKCNITGFSDLTHRLKSMNFARTKKKVAETEDFIIWDGKTDLSQLSPKELVRIKILRNHKILESKRSVLKWFFNRKAIGTTLQDYMRPFRFYNYETNRMDKAEIKYNDQIQKAYDSFKQIGKEDILVEFMLTTTGQVIPILYSTDPEDNDNACCLSLWPSDYKNTLKRLQHFYDQEQFRMIMKQEFYDQCPNAFMNRDFADLPWLANWILADRMVIVGAGLVKSTKDLEFVIQHELGHAVFVNPDQKLNKVLNTKHDSKMLPNFKSTYTKACSELYADLNAIRQTGIKTIDEYIEMISHLGERVEVSKDNNFRILMQDVLRNPFEVHEMARNYILLNFKELSKRKFAFPAYLTDTYNDPNLQVELQ